jgi:hypothetical protein
LQDELLARAAEASQGKKHPPPAGPEVLADPEQHYKLLLAQYQTTLGKETPLPPSAQAVQSAKKKEPASYDQAITDLNAALLDKLQVPDSDLVTLGKNRAQVIQDALLSDGQIEPARVFIVDVPPKPESGDKVKVEMALK